MTAAELCGAAVRAYRDGLPGWVPTMVGETPAEACLSGKASVEIRLGEAVWMVRLHRDPHRQLTGTCDVIAPDGAFVVHEMPPVESPMGGMGGLG